MIIITTIIIIIIINTDSNQRVGITELRNNGNDKRRDDDTGVIYQPDVTRMEICLNDCKPYGGK